MSKKIHPREVQKALRDIADYYGPEAQLRQLMEECAELTQACNKYLRCTAGGQKIAAPTDDPVECARQNIIEEIADVDTVVGQIMYLLNISVEDVREVELVKIQRTLDRMEEGHSLGGTPITRRKAMLGWINYKQEQPEKIGRYLCVIECKHFDNTTELGLDMLIWLPRPFDGWFSEDTNEGVACLRECGLSGQPEVKYWTPIPELPEKEAEGEQHD